MLDELSKKDSLWREFALRICGDKHTADDIVNEMYLRRWNNNRGQEMTDYYIFCTMKSIYFNMKDKIKPVTFTELSHEDKSVRPSMNYDVAYRNIPKIREPEKFEPNDEQQELLDKAAMLPYRQRELLELSYDNSLRDIQEEFGINYMYAHRSVQDARKKILGKNIHLYNNKRLKYMNRSNGFGDTIERITEATGIKSLVDSLTGGKDCGCDKRKELLNRLWTYKYKPECLDIDQKKEYKKFIKTRNIKLTGKGKASGKLTEDEVNFILDFYSIVFNTKRMKNSCSSCSGTAKSIIQMIYKLDTVFILNTTEKKQKRITKSTKE